MSKRTLGKKAAMASDNTTVVVAVHAENNGTNSEAVPDFSLIEGHISHMNCSNSNPKPNALNDIVFTLRLA